MESERLSDLVSYPLLVLGVILTLIGLSPLLSALVILSGLMQAPEGMRIGGMFVSAAFFLSMGLPALFSFLLRKRPTARTLAKVTGVLLLMFAVAFPFTLAMNVPFFIPLFFYVNAATGIWVLLRNK